ncbi:hypothetical protein K1719_044204 [Acacia pycnantha]|nr:hypothetical protein K1719_044204 [Acacia pycnantha]
MEAPLKFLCILGLVVVLGSVGAIERVEGAGNVVKKIGKNPSCLCAVLLSDTAKASGVNLQIALSIPKRCNFANRPVGYKCGPYTLP